MSPSRGPAILWTLLLACSAPGSAAADTPISHLWLPTGADMTPLAVPGSVFMTLNPRLPARPDLIADHPVATALSPDGSTLLVLTSGFNRVFDRHGDIDPALSNDYVFIFDVSDGLPRQLQAVEVPDAFAGLAFAPDGHHFYVSGGADDAVLCFVLAAGGWQPDGAPIALGHPYGEGVARDRVLAPAIAAGLAVTTDGRRAVVADFGNDAVTVLDLLHHRVAAELDLRPGKQNPAAVGRRGGTFPYAVTLCAQGAFIGSVRDRELIRIDLQGEPRIAARVGLRGNPTALLCNADGSRLYVAEDNVDRIAVIDTRSGGVQADIQLRVGGDDAPPRGLSPNALVLAPDERTLYVALGGINAVAVLGLPDGRLRGLLPTAWYPTAVALSRDGRTLYVSTAKSPAGPNPGNCSDTRPAAPAPGCAADPPRAAANAYVLQQSKGGIAVLPVPDAGSLAGLTALVIANNRPAPQLTAGERRLYATLRRRIRHLIYVIKENRTYDQVLGDLAVGNGDPGLVQFPAAITPNQHQLASAFVDLDNFYASGEVSGTGWPWSVAARTTDIVEKTVPPRYADRGFTYDSEGVNRNVNVGIATLAGRLAANPLMRPDPDILPGAADVTAPDGPDDDEPGQGRIWNEALRRHLSLRNYGFFIDLLRYGQGLKAPGALPLLREPAATGTVVAYATDPALAPHTDPYFRGFDNRLPDFYRYREWAREFAAFERRGNLPRLELVRLMHDHLGDFGSALDGIDTPLTQMADNDYAVGLLLERVAHSRYARDTLIVIVEDDAQDGPDHVDAQRTLAFVAGPYVKHAAVVSARYATTDLLRTIELVLGLRPLNIHDAYAHPMSEVFSLNNPDWSFVAAVPPILRSTALPLPAVHPPAQAAAAWSTPASCGSDLHDAAYWAQQTAGMDFSSEDRLDAAGFNRLLWRGLQRDRPYPAERGGQDLRSNRLPRLEAWKQDCSG